MKKIRLFAVLAVGIALAIGSTSTAYADDYTPPEPRQPTLSGSTIAGECVRDVPWISFNVRLVDPDSQSTGSFARLVMTNGTESATIPLGQLVNGRLSGRVLWPGASVDAEGTPTGWPGWAFVNGQWVETDGNFRWTRGPISATIEVNPSLSVPLAYPPATPVCATDPVNGRALPATGLATPMLPFAVLGAAALVGGALLLRRRAQRR